MRARHGLLLLAALLAACGSDTDARSTERDLSTPQKSFEAIKESFAKEDFGGLWSLFASASQEHYQRQHDAIQAALGTSGDQALDAFPGLQELNVTAAELRTCATARDLLVLISRKMMAHAGPEAWEQQVRSIGSTRITKADVDGDSALLTVLTPDGRTKTIPAEFRDGGWRLDLQALER